MRIAFTSKGTDWNAEIDPRFGRAQYLVIYDEEKNTLDVIDNSDAAAESHGAGPKTAQKIGDAKADVLITGNGPGNNAAEILKNFNLKVYVAARGTLKEAYENFKNDKLHLYVL